MRELIKRLLREQIEKEGENPLNPKEVRLFKYLNDHKKDLKTQDSMLEMIKTMMPFIGKSPSDARFYYEIYTQNFRPEGDYENLTKETFIDVKSFKQKKTPNSNAYQFTSAKIPFKGSNLEGYWNVNSKNQWYYVVKSYGWYPVFLFINNTWYEVSDTYSNSTSKQISRSRPTRYNSGLDEQTYLVNRNEIQKLISGVPLDDIKQQRVIDFPEEFNKQNWSKPKLVTLGWGDDAKKVKYSINDVKLKDGKVNIFVDILRAGKVVDRKMVEDPNGYIHPSPFSDDIEDKLKNLIISNNRKFLSQENTEFNFKHNV